ncbi:hypothetical protein [Streptomyces sp. NBC_00094]|uniref:hypothetical protein n=1 Tax=Streptomyces sp. NBC_00094 TaxID=2903620 RepID=UPI002253695D|nr:hypothetical protein [Streptomyces sp. NBC_00094]MCX5394559.1 hypothetical protein [Streptomyces sp. NBC_00094]
MTRPAQPRPALLFSPATAPRAAATRAGEAAATDFDARDLFAAITRAGGRWAGRATAGYALPALAASAAPETLTEPVAGHLSLALVLLCPQVLLIGWSLTGHRRESDRLDVTRRTQGLS